MLKSLIALTCLAVLAVIGYWSWGEYQNAQRSQQIAETQRSMSICDIQLYQYRSNPSDALLLLIDDCRERGFLTREQIADAAPKPDIRYRTPTAARQKQCQAAGHAVGSAEFFDCMTAY